MLKYNVFEWREEVRWKYRSMHKPTPFNTIFITQFDNNLLCGHPSIRLNCNKISICRCYTLLDFQIQCICMYACKTLEFKEEEAFEWREEVRWKYRSMHKLTPFNTIFITQFDNNLLGVHPSIRLNCNKISICRCYTLLNSQIICKSMYAKH